MAWALVASTSIGSTGGGTVVTSAIDTTGVTLLVVGIGDVAGTATTLSDSKGNTWTPVTIHTDGLDGQFYYSANPTVGSGHTFTAAGTGIFPSIGVLAFSGALLVSPFDQQNGAGNGGGNAGPLAAGSITPTEDNELIVTLLTQSNTISAVTAEPGFTIDQTVMFAGGNHFGLRIAWLAQTTAAAINATWDWTSSAAGVVCVASFKMAAVGPVTYHVSPTGSDAADGLTTGTAWETLAKVSGEVFNPGDTILFEGGETFSGALAFDDSSWVGATEASPITFGSYGTGRATISSGSARGFYVENNAGYILGDLIFVGDTATAVDGVLALNKLSGAGKLDFLEFTNLDISGYGKNGLAVYGGYGPTGVGTDTAGFNNVLIDGVISHHNCNVFTGGGGTSGIIVQGLYGFNADPTHPTHTNVHITNSTAHTNTGITGAANWTGSGIFLSQTQIGLIDFCIAHTNGENSDTGAVGIWSADADQITIEFCESYSNKTGGTNDGDGFDFDGGQTNSVMQYNYSHDNDGQGFLFYSYDDPPFLVNWDNNTIRYNISQNDCVTNARGGIHIGTDCATMAMTNAKVYNNVVYQSNPASSCFGLLGTTAVNSTTGLVANNIFYSAAGAYLIDASDRNPTSLLFRGNDYFATGAIQFRWNSTTHATYAAWRAATGQETITGSDSGKTSNPLLTNPGGGGTTGGYVPGSLTAYQLQGSSPMINAGLDLLDLFSINPGTVDYYGNSIPQGVDFDIGAFDAVAQVVDARKQIISAYMRAQ